MWWHQIFDIVTFVIYAHRLPLCSNGPVTTADNLLLNLIADSSEQRPGWLCRNLANQSAHSCVLPKGLRQSKKTIHWMLWRHSISVNSILICFCPSSFLKILVVVYFPSTCKLCCFPFFPLRPRFSRKDATCFYWRFIQSSINSFSHGPCRYTG